MKDTRLLALAVEALAVWVLVLALAILGTRPESAQPALTCQIGGTNGLPVLTFEGTCPPGQ